MLLERMHAWVKAGNIEHPSSTAELQNPAGKRATYIITTNTAKQHGRT
jgi:hypothetical protein